MWLQADGFRRALGALLLCLCWPPGLQARNLLLISVDTLRADRLGCYGYPLNPTPNFDRWAREGIRFEHAYTETPLTLPAHATLLTGLYPTAHGIRENRGFKLDERFVTLAELFRGAGFTTAAFIGSYVMASETGVGQGFEVFDEEFDRPIESVTAATELQRPAEQVTDRFLTWLEQHRSDRFFAFLHYFDPHTPRPRGYDWEVTQVDRSLGRIDAFLRDQGLLDTTDILLTSDHGESLGEHGESGHGFFIYDSTLHVPLILRPALSSMGRSRSVSEAVSLADLAPTLLALQGLGIPEAVQGRSLMPLLEGRDIGRSGLYAESHVASLQFGWSPLRSYRLGRFKFIEAPRAELYDLVTDPGETRNLYPQDLKTGSDYRRRLDQWYLAQVTAPVRPGSGVSPEVQERLASLGYVSGSRSGGPFSRIDPKDRIEAFERYHSILNRLASQNVGRDLLAEIDLLGRLAGEITGTEFLRAWLHESLGEVPESLQHYRSAVEKDPENLLARSRFAALLIRLRHYQDAERQLVRILARAPDDFKSRNNLAGLYHLTGREEQAAEQLRSIVQARPRHATAWMNLGNMLLNRRDWTGAEAAFRKVVELAPDNAAGHFQLAQALRAQGREAEAVKARERAVALDPRLRARP